MKINYFFLLILASFLTGCADSGDRERLYDEVMQIHDEVMPEMQTIMDYKEQIRQQIDSLAKSENVTKQDTAELSQLVMQLDFADEAMMDWMRHFDNSFEGKTEKEIIEYLNRQKEEIISVKESIHDALEEAREKL